MNQPLYIHFLKSKHVQMEIFHGIKTSLDYFKKICHSRPLWKEVEFLALCWLESLLRRLDLCTRNATNSQFWFADLGLRKISFSSILLSTP